MQPQALWGFLSCTVSASCLILCCCSIWFYLWCAISFWQWLVSLIIENTAKAFTNAWKLPFLGIMEQSRGLITFKIPLSGFIQEHSIHFERFSLWPISFRRGNGRRSFTSLRPYVSRNLSCNGNGARCSHRGSRKPDKLTFWYQRIEGNWSSLR